MYGTLHRYFWQNTKIFDYNHFTEFLFNNMLKRGHIEYSLKKIFQKQSRRAQLSNLPIVTRYPKTPSITSIDNSTTDPQKDLHIHLPHHPNNPSTEDISKIGNQLIADIATEFKFNNIKVTYSRAPNIGSICKKHALEYYINTNRN